MSDDTPTAIPTVDPTKDLSRAEALGQVTLVYLDALRGLGVSTFILGIPVDESPTGHGIIQCAGAGALILNLLAGLIHHLLPQDFQNLLAEMQVGAYFQQHRISAAMPLREGKPN